MGDSSLLPSAPPPSFDPPPMPQAQPAATPHQPASKELSAKDRRDKVAFEILDTERTYVQSLEQLVKFYLKPLQTENILSKQQVKTVFGNVDHILIINKELLDALEKRMKTWEQNDSLGDVLNKLIPWLRLYSEYCANYQSSNSVLQKAMEKSSVDEWLNGVKDKNNILDIFSLLIMPIQRIPRYKLLLEQLLKFTPEQHADYSPVSDALEKVEVVANLINEGVRKQENKEQLEELAKRLTGKVPRNMVTPSRYLVHEGEMTKLCRKVAKKRNFVLLNDLLLYGEANNMHRTINLNIAKVVPVEDSDKAKNAFRVMSKEKTFLFWTDTPEEKAVWAAKFEAAAQSRAKIKNIKLGEDEKTNGAEAAGDEFAPQWQNDTESKVCPLCKVKFTALRRKHHCRKCGTLACAKCSEHKFELPSLGKERVCDDCYFELSGTATERKVLRDKIATNRMSLAPSTKEALQKQLEGDWEEDPEDVDSPSTDPRKMKDKKEMDKKEKKEKDKKDKKDKRDQAKKEKKDKKDKKDRSKDIEITREGVEPVKQVAETNGKETKEQIPKIEEPSSSTPTEEDKSEARKRPATINFDSFKRKPLPPPPGGASPSTASPLPGGSKSYRGKTTSDSMPATQSAILPRPQSQMHVAEAKSHEAPAKTSAPSQSMILPPKENDNNSAPVPNKKKPQPRVPVPNRKPPPRPDEEGDGVAASPPPSPKEKPAPPSHRPAPPPASPRDKPSPPVEKPLPPTTPPHSPKTTPSSKKQRAAEIPIPKKPLPVPPPSQQPTQHNGDPLGPATHLPPPPVPPAKTLS